MELKKLTLCGAVLTACSLCALPAWAVVQGIDVSTHQGAVNWNSVKAAGIRFAYTKATEGVDFVDNRFTQNMTNANAAGVLIGPYHYGRPDSNSSNPLDAFNEANDFVDAIQPYYNSAGLYLRPVLDVEEFLDLSTVAQERAYLSEWVRDFSDQVNVRLGVRPIIYCNGNYAQNYFEANIASHELWFAKPTSTNNYASASPPTDANMGVWSDWTFWQWTWTGNVGGINPVDRNSFAGGMVDLADYIVGFIQGDYNDDGVVNAADYSKWRDTVGQTVLPGRGADGNLNGVIDAGDFNVWKSKFGGAGAGGGAISIVPEPASLVTWLIAAAETTLLTRLRRRVLCH